ncbi:hypothetical protein ACFYPC_08935 [Streptomyces sp. NPDC005808]|uniref:hypothetical protein n=1 Tax=Streptomyces sp. NPDC005808 TaxID=3364734 RepID=UPI00368CA70E
MTDLSMPATAGTTNATRRPVAASGIPKSERLAELHRLCATDYASNAFRRTDASQLLAAEPSGQHCPAAYPTDPTPCRGPVAVTVLDQNNHGADGCEYHATRLLAALDGARVYALPDAPAGAALRVFRATAGGAR